MSIEVKVGQVWRDKDKRRNTVIEIIEVIKNDDTLADQVIGLVVGTEEERTYLPERLVKRWDLIKEKTNDAKVTKALVEAAARAAEQVNEQIQRQKLKTYATREEYLEAAVQEIITEIFTPVGVEVPLVRVSVGWPGGRGPKKNVIGQCFDKRSSKDGVAQIFVTPAIDDSYVVIETLAHELIHATVEGQEGEDGEVKQHGHRGAFVQVAKAIGFMKPWRETPATEELRASLQAIVDKLGVYPHAAISVAEKPKPQPTYYLKYVSPENSDFFVRITATKIEEYGAPLDPWGNEMEEEGK